ncbi:hypothetical protein B0H67DRAFT_393032 [Lasiosphaeris hirsuta]|uniref:Uncharacterized protein n=1 Tax=Lasiosphaeris hirsuta TaxID=260670 RepID=A0AA39ZR65_9PEZI|nr:hypothetical protein B0H67DRAFT_393032 [Lasiosphaeris hirsuta]
MAHSPSPRLFWTGLDSDKPEPLDKILAALHCFQVAPVFSQNLSITFIVDREDHYRLADGFPELQKLAAAINKETPFELDPSTGKLTTMSSETALEFIKYQVFSVIAAGLKSMGPLTRGLILKPDVDDNNNLVVNKIGYIKSPTLILAFTATNSHIGPGKCAHYFAKHPSLNTVIIVQWPSPWKSRHTDSHNRWPSTPLFQPLPRSTELPRSLCRERPYPPQAERSTFGFQT